MKNLGSIRNLFTGALAMAVLALPTGAHALTATYQALLANLVNMSGDCGSPAGTHKYNGCGLEFGFNWTDTIPAGNTISAVSIAFAEGVDCNAVNTVLTSKLNTVAGTTWTTSVSSCACTPVPVAKTVVLNGAQVAAYVRGAANTFLSTYNGTCVGMSMGFGGLPATSFGTITVTYAATAAGGTDPWITPLPGAYPAGQAGFIVGTNLDRKVSLSATQTTMDTAHTALQTTANTINTTTTNTNTTVGTINTNVNTANTNINTANTNINAIKAKTDANLDATVSSRATQLTANSIETKVDNILSKFQAVTDAAELVAIERNLSDRDEKRIVRYVLPAALGGSSLEKVRKVVTDAIALAAAAGFDVTEANKEIAKGDSEAVETEWAHAFDHYRHAYDKAHSFKIPK